MKTFINFFLLSVFLLTACSKKKDVEATGNTVTISGTQYPTVKIGSQIWTSINYNGSGGFDIPNRPNAVYGKLYTLSEAKSISLPAGWRIPTVNDYNNLLLAAGGAKNNQGSVIDANYLTLASTTGWTQTNGSNSLGFNAYPAGYANGIGPTYRDLGATTIIWCSTADVSANTALILQSDVSSTYVTDYVSTDYASVRFVRDN